MAASLATGTGAVDVKNKYVLNEQFADFYNEQKCITLGLFVYKFGFLLV
jgi:hypothetical protein